MGGGVRAIQRSIDCPKLKTTSTTSRYRHRDSTVRRDAEPHRLVAVGSAAGARSCIRDEVVDGSTAQGSESTHSLKRGNLATKRLYVEERPQTVRLARERLSLCPQAAVLRHTTPARSPSQAGKVGRQAASPADTTHAAAMRKPPTTMDGLNSSPTICRANKAPHKGSVAKMTVASAELISASAAASAKEHPAVVTIPVHSRAASTGRWSMGDPVMAMARAVKPGRGSGSFSGSEPAAAANHSRATKRTATRFHAVRATGSAIPGEVFRWRVMARSQSQ
eukprot:scaffold316241_cov35-Tisochrysis_lutea.AAC.1